MNKKELTYKEIGIIADITRVDKKTLLYLAKENLLNIQKSRAIVITNHYQKMTDAGKMNNTQIIEKLALANKMSKSSIEKIIYSK